MASSPPPWPNDADWRPGTPSSVDDIWSAPPPPPDLSPQSAPPAGPVSSPSPQLAVPAKPGRGEITATGGLLALCAGVHIAAMFPAYTGNPPTSVVSTPYEAATYICLIVGWVAAALLVLSGLSVRGGVALGIGIASVELGFLITDAAGSVQAAGRVSPGVWFAFAGLGLGAAGVLLGASTVPMGGPRVRPYGQSLHARSVMTVLVALLAVVAFLPSWDTYEAVNSAGRTVTVTLGNAFTQPGGVMAGELVAALAIAVIVILAAFWAPPVVGALMMAGVVVALASQLISAVVQVNQPLAVTAAGGAANLSLTWFWALDVGATVALAGLALWTGLASREVPRQARSLAAPA